jgi:hypothetical protein
MRYSSDSDDVCSEVVAIVRTSIANQTRYTMAHRKSVAAVAKHSTPYHSIASEPVDRLRPNGQIKKCNHFSYRRPFCKIFCNYSMHVAVCYTVALPSVLKVVWRSSLLVRHVADFKIDPQAYWGTCGQNRCFKDGWPRPPDPQNMNFLEASVQNFTLANPVKGSSYIPVYICA